MLIVETTFFYLDRHRFLVSGHNKKIFCQIVSALEFIKVGLRQKTQEITMFYLFIPTCIFLFIVSLEKSILKTSQKTTVA